MHLVFALLENAPMEFLIIDFYQVGVHENFYKELKQYLRHERHTVAGRAGKGDPVYVNFLNRPKQKAPRGAGLGVVAHSNNRVSRTCFGGVAMIAPLTCSGPDASFFGEAGDSN